MLGKIVKWLLALAVVAVLGAAAWLHFATPALLGGAMAYSAKMVCSYQFLAWRDGQEVLAEDVHAPAAHPLLRYITADVDPLTRTVTTRLMGAIGAGRAVYRDGFGCVTVPAGSEIAVLPPPAAPRVPDMAALWPRGERVEPSQDPAVAAILEDPEMTGPGMRAVVVVHNGRLVGERYGEGFAADTPLLGWSMTKTVTAALIGILVGEERMSLDQDGLFEEWSGDERAEITVADLMAMSSGLEFNEDYGGLTDVTRMLYLEPDMATFAAAKPLVAPRGGYFSYSSGTTALLSRIWQDAFAEPAAMYAFPREALFGPLRMSSAVFEADASGTFAGSSYLYATARDWARFGEFLRNGGVWQGERILPDGFVGWMSEAAPASSGQYGRGQLWLRGPGDGTDDHGLPEDAFWIRGHDGQTTTVIPSSGLVVVRMGLTPSRLGYRPQRLVRALVDALE